MKHAAIKKISIIFRVLILISVILSTAVNASSGGGSVDTSGVNQSLGEIVWILTLIGEAVCIGKCIQIGWMFIVGTIQDKARAKEALFPWMVGALLLFGAAWLGPMIINVIGRGFIGRPVLDY